MIETTYKLKPVDSSNEPVAVEFDDLSGLVLFGTARGYLIYVNDCPAPIELFCDEHIPDEFRYRFTSDDLDYVAVVPSALFEVSHPLINVFEGSGNWFGRCYTASSYMGGGVVAYYGYHA